MRAPTVSNNSVCTAAATDFLKEMMVLAKPENLEDGPAGDVIADGGVRIQNMKKGSKACTDLLKGKVSSCQVIYSTREGVDYSPDPAGDFVSVTVCCRHHECPYAQNDD